MHALIGGLALSVASGVVHLAPAGILVLRDDLDPSTGSIETTVTTLGGVGLGVIVCGVYRVARARWARL